jgi:NADH-quinone oxidoreductase subunit L
VGQHASWLWWIPALPLLGSLVAGVLHFLVLRERSSDPSASSRARLAGLVAVAAIGGSFVLSLAAFLALRGSSATALASSAWPWIDAGSLRIDVAMVVDRLSSVMILVITGVGFLIHVYSLGYMQRDPGFAKFFAYLNLFVAMMLVLVLSSNLLGLFVGWEGVGLCSYLLIGFWYQKGWPAEAAQKAFVVNRIGDACFLVGSFLCVKLFGSLDLARIAESGARLAGDPATVGTLAVAALLLFGGACGKSAQIPLFTWLPDAMAGPTPVSALIHAATMVTAGVYLVVRLNPLFAASPTVLFVVGAIGALTAFVAGTTAIVQRDLKKVLAYSTVSQLGYMFLGLSSGAWAAAIFHLVTHAFFKGLLFLGAGSVIHGMHDEQDMHRMGGLAFHMPRTFLTFLVGAAALSGLPPLAGFFSKDEILASAFARGGPYLVLWAIGLVTAAITAYYSWRMVALVFFGGERFDAHHVHPHESPTIMTTPLVVLAFLAALGGGLGLPAVLHLPHLLDHWLEPVTAAGSNILVQTYGSLAEVTHATEWTLLLIGAGVAFAFAHLGFRAHKHGLEGDAAIARRMPRASALWGEAWGVDRAYASLIVQPVKLAGFLIAVVVDQFAIDGLVNGTAALAKAAGTRVRRMTDGSIATYALWMGGVTASIAIVWIWWGGA